MAHDRQAQARAAEVARAPLVNPVESLKNPPQILGGNANAGIFDVNRSGGRRPSIGRVPMRTFPLAGVYLTALSSKLIRACSINLGSQITWTDGGMSQ